MTAVNLRAGRGTLADVIAISVGQPRPGEVCYFARSGYGGGVVRVLTAAGWVEHDQALAEAARIGRQLRGRRRLQALAAEIARRRQRDRAAAAALAAQAQAVRQARGRDRLRLLAAHLPPTRRAGR